MKKIISGKLYDTSTASLVWEYSSSENRRDFSHYDEDLYRKRTGEYFLHGDGGPMSKYAERIDDNSWSGGSKIIPLTMNEAREWAEAHMDADEYQSEFGEVVDDESRTVLSISISSAAASKAKRIATERGISVSALIDTLITNI